MPPEFTGFLARLGAGNVAAISGVSINTIRGIATGRVLAGPLVRVRIATAMEMFKMSMLMEAGASETTALVARRMSFGQVDRYVQRMQQIVDAIARDRAIPGEGYSKQDYKDMILDGMAKSEKSVTEMFEKYVA